MSATSTEFYALSTDDDQPNAMIKVCIFFLVPQAKNNFLQFHVNVRSEQAENLSNTLLMMIITTLLLKTKNFFLRSTQQQIFDVISMHNFNFYTRRKEEATRASFAGWGGKKTSTQHETKGFRSHLWFSVFYCVAHNMIIIIIATSMKLFSLAAFLLHFLGAYCTALID